MKIISIFFILSNFIFCDSNIWLSIGNDGKYEVSSIYGYYNDDDLKNTGVELGYDFSFKKINKLSFGPGLAYSFKPLSYLDYHSNIEIGFFSVYLFSDYWINDKISTKATLGLGFPSHDAEDSNPELIYTIGLNYKITNKVFIGISYKIYNLSDDISDWKFSRICMDIGSFNFK